MTRGKIDPVDLVAMPVFLLGSLIELDLLPVDSVPLLGDPAQVLFTLGSGAGSVEITLGTAMTLGALAVVAYTNEWDTAQLAGIQLWIIIATVGLIILPPFVPLLENWLSGSLAAVGALVIQTSGYTILSYVG